MQALQKENVAIQGPSKLLFTIQDNENYQLHRNEVNEMGATWNSFKTDHLVPISNAKTV